MNTNHDVLTALIEVMKDTTWQIVDVVKPTIFGEDENGIESIHWEDKVFEKQESDSVFFKYEYIWQAQEYDDCYYGEMLFPIENEEYILVKFQC